MNLWSPAFISIDTIAVCCCTDKCTSQMAYNKLIIYIMHGKVQAQVQAQVEVEVLKVAALQAHERYRDLNGQMRLAAPGAQPPHAGTRGAGRQARTHPQHE